MISLYFVRKFSYQVNSALDEGKVIGHMELSCENIEKKKSTVQTNDPCIPFGLPGNIHWNTMKLKNSILDVQLLFFS